MNYTARFCHLEEKPDFVIGQLIYPNQLVGRMGNTGQSTAAHLHHDVVKGFFKNVYRMSEIEYDTETILQMKYFLDDLLFKHPLEITTYFGDPDYIIKGKWKMHPGYDVVPKDRKDSHAHYNIYWNRSFCGKILSVGNDSAYGNYVNIGFSI